MPWGPPGALSPLHPSVADSLPWGGWQSNTVLWDLAVPSLTPQVGFPLLICLSLRACSLLSPRWGAEIACDDAA